MTAFTESFDMLASAIATRFVGDLHALDRTTGVVVRASIGPPSRAA